MVNNMSNYYRTTEGIDLFWDTFLDILDKGRNRYIRMTKTELIEFLKESEFLNEMGYKIIPKGNR